MISEYGFGNSPCTLSCPKYLEFRNTIWASAFSGSFSTAYFFGGNVTINNLCWGGDAIKSYKPLSLFLKNEIFNSSTQTFIPIGNSLSVYNSYNPTLGRDSCPPDASPKLNLYNYAPVSWAVDIKNTPVNLKYFVSDISTSDDRNIQVFALKNQNKVIGWVSNKNYYWFNVHHAVDGGTCPELINPNVSATNPVSLTPITGKTMTISNLLCNGNYRIEWWSSFYNYDINKDGVNDDGGIIPELTISTATAINGTLTINIPNLQAIEQGQKPFAPDYGFKIIYLGQGQFQNKIWNHEATETTNSNSARVSGDIAVSKIDNQIFYKGEDNYLNHLFYGNNKFNHDGLVLNWWTQSINYQVANDSKILIGSANTVFYKGKNNRMQHYNWTSSGWVHDETDKWAVNPEVISGDMTIGVNDELYYRGSSTGFIQHLFYNFQTNKWTLDGLVSNYSSQNVNYKVSSLGKIIALENYYDIFYRGQDDRMQHYYKAGSIWNHDYIDMWDPNTNYKIAGDMVVANGELFYRGVDGYIQHFYWSPSTGHWTHDGLVSNWQSQNVQFKIASDSKILVGLGGDLFYKGDDGRLQHYFKGGSTWYHDYIDMWDANPNFKIVGDMDIDKDNAIIYFRGTDGFMHTFYYEPGTSKWTHRYLATSTENINYKVNGKIIIGLNKMVFYKGADNRIQNYIWNNPCENTTSSKLANLSEDYKPFLENHESFYTSQNKITCYPNPISSNAVIEFIVDDNQSNVFLEVFDIMGNKVKVLINGNQHDKGKYQIELNCNELTDGLYLLKYIENDKNISMTKILIDK